MKKALVILLLMVYGASSFGMTVHFHYCCGKLKSVDFTPPKDSHCGVGKSYQMSGKACCENKQIALKVTSEQEFAKLLHASFSPDASKPEEQPLFVVNLTESRGLLPVAHGPPLNLAQPIYLLNCVFRI